MIENKNILLTGGTDGIGLALAARLSQTNRVLIIGRRAAREIALPPAAHYRRANLSQLNDINALCSDLGDETFDHVIHNAAIGWVGNLGEEPANLVPEMITANVTAPLHLTRALSPGLMRTKGLVTFIGSTASGTAAPNFALYTATKTALSDAARNLATEWCGRVDVQIIHPGPTRTHFHAKSGMEKPPLANLFMGAGEVAGGIITAMEKRTRHKRFGLPAMLIAATKRGFRDAGLDEAENT